MTQNPQGFKQFEGDELQACGCATGATCASKCTAECKNPNSLNGTSPCGQCLAEQEADPQNSLCTLQAAGTCQGQTGPNQCNDFLQCEEKCPGN